MNILQVSFGYPPAYKSGGASRSAKELSEALAQRGHSVTVYTTDVSEPDADTPPSEEEINSVSVKRFKTVSHDLTYNHKIPISPRLWAALRSNRNKFDIAHAHEFRTFSTLSLYTASSDAFPYVLQPRGEIPRESKTGLKTYFDLVVGRRILNNAGAVIASSKIESDQYDEYFEEIIPDVHLIPNGVDISNYRPTSPSDEFLAEYGISPSENNILYLGRISERKGVDLLIESVSKVVEGGENANLILAGPDEGALPAAKELADSLGMSDSLTITGPLYGDEKLMAYTVADVSVLPSKTKQESFGRVVIESIACGTPVVSTNVCGVTEWIDDGLSVAEPNAASLAEKLTSVLFSTGSEMTITDGGGLDGLSWGDVAAATEDVYETVLNAQSQ